MTLALLLLALTGCSRDAPEQILRKTIDDMQANIEGRDGSAVMEHVAEDFIGQRGMDRAGLRRYLAGLTLRHGQIGIVLGPLDVDIQGERASVRFTAATAGGQRGLPDTGRVYAVETGWRMEGGRWLLVAAQWQ